MRVQDVRRDEGAEPWPGRRDFAELEDVVVMDLRRGSADLRCVAMGFSDDGRTVDMVEVWSFSFGSTIGRGCLDFQCRLEAVLDLRILCGLLSFASKRNVSSKALSLRFMIVTCM